uniref:(northern house mosquito) hypothetical protein n=1 Tax=Culex pipiens TaxID=7175 RepID=A0A8D8IYV6_CULPI
MSFPSGPTASPSPARPRVSVSADERDFERCKGATFMGLLLALMMLVVVLLLLLIDDCGLFVLLFCAWKLLLLLEACVVAWIIGSGANLTRGPECRMFPLDGELTSGMCEDCSWTPTCCIGWLDIMIGPRWGLPMLPSCIWPWPVRAWWRFNGMPPTFDFECCSELL